MAIGRGETALWENPYQSVNTNLPGGANAFAQPGATITNNYVVTIINGKVTVTMDGAQVFSSNARFPPWLIYTSLQLLALTMSK